MRKSTLRGGKLLRRGITTGTCAAAAAAAATHQLLFATDVTSLPLRLPNGEETVVPVCESGCDETGAFAAVRKDAGDDPDITDGVRIVAHVSLCADADITIDGGTGVGRVTKPGLDQPVGNAAINSVPRRMIAEAVRGVLDAAGQTGGAHVRIDIPEGETLAKKTFNPRLGIVGGLSVLGTSGVVEPMSEDALADSIRVEINMRAALGKRTLLLTPGNYGRDFLRSHADIAEGSVICCSNFIGEMLDEACRKGFTRILLVAHLGKLIKLAANIFNTHSKYGDARLDILTAHAACCGLSPDKARDLMHCATVDAGLDVLGDAQTAVIDRVMRAVQKNVALRVPVPTELATFTNVRGPLWQSEGFDEALQCFLREEA